MSEHRSALTELVLTRWRNFYREPGVLFWSFGFPIVLAIALGIAFRNRPAEPVLAAVEAVDGGAAICDALADNPNVKCQLMSPEDATRSLRTGKVAIVVVPGAPRSYRYDPTRAESQLARSVVDDQLQRAEGREDRFPVVEAHVTEPGSRYIDFLIPGLIGSGLMQGGLWGVGYVIVDMRTRKLMKRLVATPMKKRDFLLAFVIARGLFLVVELPVLIGFGSIVFGVPVHGSLLSIALVCVLGSLTFAGLGLLVASRAQNVQTVSGLINLATLPMFILSGTFFSASRFPDVIQPLVRLLPLTALNDALRALMLDGASLAAIGREIAVLAVWGAGCFILALKLFRWR